MYVKSTLFLISYSLTSRSNLGNQDYKLENSNITFQPNASKVVIVSIYIEDETLVDNDENFSVILSSNSPMLIVGYPNVTVVTIKNDDGKMFWRYFILFVLCLTRILAQQHKSPLILLVFFKALR